jgi:hypothetical protein
MPRRLEAWIIKLEARRRPAEGLFFLAWGRSDREAVALIESLRASGNLNDKDIVVAATWPKADAMPLSRWVGTWGLSRDERKVLDDEIERVLGHLLPDEYESSTAERAGMALLSDEELIAELWHDAKDGLLSA